MLRFIERLRTKPKEVKDRYAFFVATGVTSVIALVWLATLPGHFSQTEVAEVPENIGAFSQFFSEFRNNAAAVFTSVREQVPEAPEEEGAADSPAATSSERSPIAVPTLSEETISAARERANPQPPPRTVLITTTSTSLATTSEMSQ